MTRKEWDDLVRDRPELFEAWPWLLDSELFFAQPWLLNSSPLWGWDGIPKATLEWITKRSVDQVVTELTAHLLAK